MSAPRGGSQPAPLEAIRVAAFDAYSGLDEASLSVVASFPVDGRAAGEELAPHFRPDGESSWSLELEKPAAVEDGLLVVRVRDRQGNETTVERSFNAAGGR